MSDIVERLRQGMWVDGGGARAMTNCMDEAADLIKALEAENERLREALEACAAYFDDRSDVVWEGDAPNREMCLLTMVQTALEK